MQGTLLANFDQVFSPGSATEEQATPDPAPLHSLGSCYVVWLVVFV